VALKTKVTYSWTRLDVCFTKKLFHELRKITKSKKPVNPPTISEIVTRGMVLAIRAREKQDKKSGVVWIEINNDKVAGTARSTDRSSSWPQAIPSRSPGGLVPALFPAGLRHNFWWQTVRPSTIRQTMTEMCHNRPSRPFSE
jgi:hypothetical protein